ncbi:Uncharacterised protein [Brucella melitensis]|nr:Uncharacterised protein [Brucella melitensis]
MKIRQVVARSVDFQAAHNGVRRIDRDRIAGAKAVEDGRPSPVSSMARSMTTAPSCLPARSRTTSPGSAFSIAACTLSPTSNIDLPCLRACAKWRGKQAHDAAVRNRRGRTMSVRPFSVRRAYGPHFICMAWRTRAVIPPHTRLGGLERDRSRRLRCDFHVHTELTKRNHGSGLRSHRYW